MVENYNEVKDQIDNVNGETNPDKPVSPPSGGGGTIDNGIKGFNELIEALEEADENKTTTITLSKNFSGTSNETIEVTKPVTIEGNGATLKFNVTIEDYKNNGLLIGNTKGVTINNLTVDMGKDNTKWERLYAIQVYKATDVTLNNFTGTNGDAALLVNGSEVKLKGKVDVSGNEFGGIEVSNGTNVDAVQSLDISGATLVNTTESFNKKLPTIWEDGVETKDSNPRVTGANNLNVVYLSEEKQRHYYLEEAAVVEGNDKANITTSFNGAPEYLSVKIEFNDNISISKIDSLSVKLIKDGEILSTNTLNELGFFLHGTDNGDGVEPFTFKNSEDKEFIRPTPDGDVRTISTSFIQRENDFHGMKNAEDLGDGKGTTQSAWNKGAYTDWIKPDSIVVEFKKDGILYVVKKTGNIAWVVSPE